MEEKLIAKEKEYLANTLSVLRTQAEKIDAELGETGQTLIEQRHRIWENLSDMDDTEQSQEETQAQLKGEHYVMLAKRRNMIDNLLYSPYFGKVVFGETSDKRIAFYVGLSQVDDGKGGIYVIDWRAPIADLYYNYDVGKAAFEAPMGTVRGEIYAKYQFKITGGELRFVVDTSTTILDEVLLAELGKNASVNMRQIAATIQREQNAVIRHSYGDNVLVFGVAGSGKTSIALHRVAYILYHCRSALKASDMLIITPNKAFTKYIGNVLPELGEEMAKQLSIEDIVRNELSEYYYETRHEHLEKIYATPPDEASIADMRYKASTRFVEDVERFAKRVERASFKPRDFVVGKTYVCPRSTFEVLYGKRFAAYPLLVRMRKIVEYVVRDMGDTYHSKLSPALRDRVSEMIMSMFTRYNTLAMYRIMLRDLAEKEGAPVKTFGEDDPIPYEDVFGFILFKSHIEGVRLKGNKVKHLFIDEMQDYTPAQYAYFNRVFGCPKTVLGDVNQMADPFLNVGDEETARAMLGGESCVRFDINTSYRSTYEIATYANRFTPVAITPIDRHGEEPVVAAVAAEDLVRRIKAEVNVARQKGYTSVAIIAKSADEARRLQDELRSIGAVLLLNADATYVGGVVVTTAFAAKGFEFDQVILADASDALYANPWDDRLLYISVTRALHRLVVLYTGKPSRYLGV